MNWFVNKACPEMMSAAAAKLLQSCPTLCDPTDSSLPGSPIPGILQARTLEWVAISFSNAWKWKVKVKSLRLSTWKLYSRVQLLATPWTAVYQDPPSMGFSRQEYWSGVPLPSPEIMSGRVQMWAQVWLWLVSGMLIHTTTQRGFGRYQVQAWWQHQS